MTYLHFHLVFILPPLLLVAWRFREAASRLGTRGFVALPLIALIAFVYTTPWDNYLVANGIWWYGPDRVIGTIGFVPVEEYLFFILQPLLTGGFLCHALAGTWGGGSAPVNAQSGNSPAGAGGDGGKWKLRIAGAAPWLVLTAIGLHLVLRGPENGTYMGLILVWATPVIALMWLFMGPGIWQLRRPVAAAIAIPTFYLWIADGVAIRAGIWEISAEHTFGWAPLGLPLEEATFFFVTNVLVAFGVILLVLPGLPGSSDRSDPRDASRLLPIPSSSNHHETIIKPSSG